MPRIYSPNEVHNYLPGEVDFIHGAAAVPSGASTAWFSKQGYEVDVTKHVLTVADTLPKETLLKVAAELGLTISETISKRWLVHAINTATATAQEADYTITYANGSASATGDAPVEADKFIGDVFTVKANAFALTGHTFIGWKDGDDVIHQPGDKITMAGANITLTAQWDED